MTVEAVLRTGQDGSWPEPRLQLRLVAVLVAIVVAASLAGAFSTTAASANSRHLQARARSALSVTLAASARRVTVGRSVTFVASVDGPAVLRSIHLRFGDGTPASQTDGEPSCAAGTSLHVQMSVRYHHAYRRPGTFRVVLTVRTSAHDTGCSQTTTVREATIVVLPQH